MALPKFSTENTYTTQELLDLTNEAIAKVTAGVEFYTTPGGGQAKYPSLSALHESQATLEAKLASENSAGQSTYTIPRLTRAR